MADNREAIEKEVTIILEGKSGAGKTTLICNLLDEEIEPILTAKEGTKEPKISTFKKNRVKAIIIDTPGVKFKEDALTKLEKIKKQIVENEKITKFDLLVYCISIKPGTRFQQENDKITKGLHDYYGKEIWKNCVVVFTFSNFALDHFKNDEKKFLACTEAAIREFQASLRKLDVSVDDADPRTIFNWNAVTKNQATLENVILGIPAGKKKEDQVLPGIEVKKDEQWTNILFDEMVKKCKDRGTLIQFKYGNEFPKKYKALLAGGAAGLGSAGAIVGVVVAGPIGALVGGIIGSAVGTVTGALAGYYKK